MQYKITQIREARVKRVYIVTADSAEEAEDLVYDYGTYDSVNEEIVHLGDTIDETIREI